MSGNSAEQPQNQAQEHAQKKREEKDRMMDLLKERVDEWNAKRGDLPEIVMRGSSIQMDRYILFLDFDQLPSLTDYVLVLRVGQERKPIFWPEPAAVRHRLEPIVSDERGSIVWVHQLGTFTSAAVVELALDMLTSYYSRHKPN